MTVFARLITVLLFCVFSVSAFAHKYKDHAEEGVKLPFDSPYCDLNDNQNIEKSEMTPDNLCMLGDSNTVFAEKPIASLGLKKGELILTIDDGPNALVTRPILDLLDQYGIKASFFIVGSRIPANRALIREMVQRGHLVGNHTWSHDVKHITSTTITGEVLRAHKALFDALGFNQSRLLFRAPGLGWSAPKAINLNANSTTRKYIGPIHANLGTDEPRADWSCWSKGVSAQTCAGWYFQDIVNTGRGIILSHDIFSKAGQGNTYEMLRILLNRLDTEAGGITNRSGRGVWTFRHLPESHTLDQFDEGAVAPPPAPPSDGIVREFRNNGVNVRTDALADVGAITDQTKIPVAGGFLKTGNLTQVTLLGSEITIGSNRFKRVRIDGTTPGFERFIQMTVYIWSEAF